jgi:hypothetical protein
MASRIATHRKETDNVVERIGRRILVADGEVMCSFRNYKDVWSEKRYSCSEFES